MFCHVLASPNGLVSPLGLVQMMSPASPSTAYQRPGLCFSRQGPTLGVKLYFQIALSAESVFSFGSTRGNPTCHAQPCPNTWSMWHALYEPQTPACAGSLIWK